MCAFGRYFLRLRIETTSYYSESFRKPPLPLRSPYGVVSYSYLILNGINTTSIEVVSFSYRV